MKSTATILKILALTITAPTVIATTISSPAASPTSAENLPYSSRNPFIWDNDSEYDAFSLALCMALANNGKIDLIGISESPHPYKTSTESYQQIVNYARNSGWKNIPDATSIGYKYYMTGLTRPANGSIDSTVPIDTAGARMIRDKVLSVGTASLPVVIGTGGALTTVASGYLLANQAGKGAEFSRKVVIYAGAGADGRHNFNGYNDTQDSWALYVVLNRLKVVLTEYVSPNIQQLKFWQTIDKLPNNEMGKYMKSVKAKWPYGSEKWVGDEQPVLTLLNPRAGVFFKKTERISFDRWHTQWPGGDYGRNSLNYSVYKAILNVKTDASSNDIAVWSYSNQDDFIVSTFNQAFKGGSSK